MVRVNNLESPPDQFRPESVHENNLGKLAPSLYSEYSSHFPERSGSDNVVRSDGTLDFSPSIYPDLPAHDSLMAGAYGVGIGKNPDGSYDVNSRILDDSQTQQNSIVDGILRTVEQGLLNPDGANNQSDANAQQADGSTESQPAPLGMNPMGMEAWQGWDNQDPMTDDQSY